ncbi:hypothetical protein OE749_10615 [Aestuariibacter sp. AA17]|uniref:Uncharacterized protein n=1 Tax=Fluctibacter corallii TaxID=2984329 RepID=A0ABT3A8Y2_9ALTE|nr:hypothetical protein [Aestuariibacter sp. AA17]MCV2885143.1 hypothetical protein [Aestuariibacter sp. AA17]
MRSLFIIFVIGLCTTSALAFVSAEQDVDDTVTVKPNTLVLLENRLSEVDQTRNDRNSRLRIERIQHYLDAARQSWNAGWNTRAKDFAERGLRLLELQLSHQQEDVAFIFRYTRIPQSPIDLMAAPLRAQAYV